MTDNNKKTGGARKDPAGLVSIYELYGHFFSPILMIPAVYSSFKSVPNLL